MFRHIFQCPTCKIVSCFDDSDRIDKDSTLEASCECGIRQHKFVETRNIKN